MRNRELVRMLVLAFCFEFTDICIVVGSLTSNDGRATGPISASSSLTSLAPTLSTLTDTNVPTPPRSDRTLVGSSTGTGGHNSDGEDEPVHGPSDLSVKREEEEPTAFKRRPRRSEAALLVVDTPGAMPEALEQLGGDDDDEGRPRPRRAQIVKSYDLIKRRAPRKKKSDTPPPEEPPRRGRKSHKEPTPSPSPEESEEEQERAPTCRTCGKVLPIISFEGSIVYGDFGEEDDKEHDCPRYDRPCPYFPPLQPLTTPNSDVCATFSFIAPLGPGVCISPALPSCLPHERIAYRRITFPHAK
jgi:hypothetical protein